MRVKEEFFSRGNFKIGNGQSRRFWEDTWLGDAPLAIQYPDLYSIVYRKQVLVANVLSHSPLNITFRRSLSGNKWNRWLHLVNRLMLIELSSDQDLFVWSLTNSGKFTVKSMYLDMMNDNTKYLKRYIWKIKVPLKIKIFMWFFHHKVLLTKANLSNKKWEGRKTCCFCHKDETIQHLFFECPFAKVIWRIIHMTFNLAPPKNVTNLFGNWLKDIPKKEFLQIRVGVCAIVWAMWNVRKDFIFKKPRTPTFLQVIPLAIHWIRMWSYLQPVEDRQDMDSGCNRLEMVARDIYSQCGW
jgi:hypothetical protein